MVRLNLAYSLLYNLIGASVAPMALPMPLTSMTAIFSSVLGRIFRAPPPEGRAQAQTRST